jgi:hypothetical protein
MKRTVRIAVTALVVLTTLYMGAVAARIVYRKHYVWLPGYAVWWWNRPPLAERTHLLVLFADHWEPSTFYERADRWEEGYPRLADRHRDSEGRPLQHTWFYPVEQPYTYPLQVLQRLVQRGYGEVEVHFHHRDDSRVSAGRKIDVGLQLLQSYGFAKTITGETRFAFIHGNMHLDGSGEYCGVTEELALLKEKGCFADFTFPALWEQSQPSHVNELRYVIDDPKPKSYDSGQVVSVGSAPPPQGLLLFPGPLSVTYAGLSRLLLGAEDGHLRAGVPMSTARVDRWVNTAVHVNGRPEWVFVKLWGHGAASDGDVEDLLDGSFDRALDYMEQRYNDRERYTLHYVTAREAYNVAMAAAAGMSGNPACYYDWAIPPYQAGPPASATPPALACGTPAQTRRPAADPLTSERGSASVVLEPSHLPATPRP